MSKEVRYHPCRKGQWIADSLVCSVLQCGIIPKKVTIAGLQSVMMKGNYFVLFDLNGTSAAAPAPFRGLQ